MEWFALLAGAAASTLAFLTPVVRLNGLLSRLNALLDALQVRTLRCEARLDEYEIRFAKSESRAAETAEAVRQAHHRIDELKKE